jgi:hypothetical protein
MMRFAPHRDQRLDLVLHAGLDVGLAAVTRISQQGLDSPQPLGQLAQLLEHGLELVLVNAGRSQPGAHNEQAFGVHRELRVIGLVKAPAGHWHDARVGIGQIDLVGRPRPRLGRLGFDPAGLLAGMALALAPLPLGLVHGLLALEALLGPLLDLRLGGLDRLQPLLAPDDLARQVHRRVALLPVGALGLPQQPLDLLAQLRLQALGVRVRQRFVARSVGLNLVPSEHRLTGSFICWASSNTCKNTSRT